MAAQNTTNSNTLANLLTILLLILLFPVGAIVMWVWPKWQAWVKIIITIFVTLVFLFILLPFTAAILITVVNPQEQIRKANEAKQKQTQLEQMQSAIPSPSTKKTK